MAKLAAVLLALSLSSIPLVAHADRDRGSSGGGGGRLGQVSEGLGRATGGSVGGGSSGGGSNRGDSWYVDRDHRDRYDHHAAEPVVVVSPDAGITPVGPPPKPRNISVDFFVGAQKVYESDASLSVELAFNEGRFRFGGSFSRYYERQPDDSALTLTLPTLYLGYRIDDGGPTRAHFEFGAVAVESDNDPVMDSSIGGVMGGIRVEHRFSRRIALLGDAQVMAFEKDVRAAAMRAGVRLGYLQATLRVLDLNVGPALFGPEIGLRF